MADRKTLDELTLMDDYMFAQVMRDTRHLKPLLEYILQIKIKKIELIELQKTKKEGYDSKGVRLDLYVTDDAGAVYNVEVQTSNKRNLPKRMRYYQSIIDISILTPGMEYGSLKKSFVIFICNYDEYGRDRYLYTFENTCREEPDLKFGDESYKVVVNTKGKKGDINGHLREILEYLEDGSVTGDYSRELDEAVKAVKSSEERRLEYMLLVTRDNEMRAEGRAEGIAEGRAEGRAEGIAEGKAEGEIIGAIKLYHDELGLVPEEIVSRIAVRFSLREDAAKKYVEETLHLNGPD